MNFSPKIKLYMAIDVALVNEHSMIKLLNIILKKRNIFRDSNITSMLFFFHLCKIFLWLFF